jgi:hypothetical protein
MPTLFPYTTLFRSTSGRFADARRTPSKALGVVDPAGGDDACRGGSRSPGIAGRIEVTAAAKILAP